ncbi:ATP-binding protein [Bacteroidales bacterium]|nr:ATP-binding protein [Bacteroidales bacterium]
MTELSLYLLDIVHNSIRAKATEIDVNIIESEMDDTLKIKIEDNGCGMTIETAEKALDPFFTTRTTRKVGMGLALLKMLAEQTGGTLTLDSKLNVGTVLHVHFGLTHLDRPEWGDLPGTMQSLLSGNPHVVFKYSHKRNDNAFEISTTEIKEAIPDIPIEDVRVSKMIGEIIEGNLCELGIV